VLTGDSIVAKIALPGPDSVSVSSMILEGGDTLWAASTRALYRIANRRAVEIRAPGLTNILEGSPALAIARGQLWMAGTTGIARIPLSELHRAADGHPTALHPLVFGPLDGLPDGRTSELTVFPIRTARDGRVWILTDAGLAVADPSTRSVNRIPPLVHIEEVSIAGVTRAISDGGTIAPDPGRVAIRFTSPSLGLPERVRVEYRLDGVDKDWIEGKPPRVAEYSQLRPGRYRFRVRAWNEDGVQSVGEATLGFRVLPEWYQAWWFFGLCILGVAAMSGGVVVAAQSRRTRRIAKDAQARFDAVLAERARMARELHDTLLQGFTGITLQLDGVRDALRAQSQPLEHELSQILQRADRTLREAREMVWDIRQPRSDADDLGETLRALTKEFVATVEWRYVIDGPSRQLPPVVVTTILRIGKEAIVNALTHADPKSILLHLTYEPRRVLLEICDDGRGVDLAVFDSAASRGHWGVAGMRERAQAAGGTLLLTSSPIDGTCVCLSLPAEPIA
jgi:signal transduction histidine kinase